MVFFFFSLSCEEQFLLCLCLLWVLRLALHVPGKGSVTESHPKNLSNPFTVLRSRSKKRISGGGSGSSSSCMLDLRLLV